MKRITKLVILSLAVLTVLSSALFSAWSAPTSDRLRLSDESNLTMILGNKYITGICGTITADVLEDNFAHPVIITSPKNETLSGDTLVPSDAVVSKGTSSIKVLIYGDCDRNGSLALSDVSAMLKHIAGWSVDICTDAADVNDDGTRTLADVTLLLKKLSGWNVCLGVDITPEQITLSYYDKDCTKIGVIWHTTDKTQNPAVQITEGDTQDFSSARTIIGDTNMGMGDNNSRAVIDGLEYGKTYSYRVGDTSGYWGTPATFTMRDESEGSFTFICFTDSQSQNSSAGDYFRAAWDNALTAYPEAELAIHCGDVVESVGPGDWRDMLEPSAEHLRRIPMMTVSGNHETSYAGTQGVKMQYNHFCTDMPTQESYNSGYFYSFTYGSVHFVMLNTNKQGTPDDSLSEEQVTWLRSDLAENTAKWTVVVMHHPMYSTGTGSNDRWNDPMTLAIREQLTPLFAEYGVDAVIAGHDHVYYCTKPIDDSGNVVADAATESVDGTGYYNDPDGVIYTTPGCTGSSARSLCTTHLEYYRATSDMLTRSYLAVTVADDKIQFDLCIPESFGETKVLDSWGIVK